MSTISSLDTRIFMYIIMGIHRMKAKVGSLDIGDSLIKSMAWAHWPSLFLFIWAVSRGGLFRWGFIVYFIYNCSDWCDLLLPLCHIECVIL